MPQRRNEELLLAVRALTAYSTPPWPQLPSPWHRLSGNVSLPTDVSAWLEVDSRLLWWPDLIILTPLHCMWSSLHSNTCINQSNFPVCNSSTGEKILPQQCWYNVFSIPLSTCYWIVLMYMVVEDLAQFPPEYSTTYDLWRYTAVLERSLLDTSCYNCLQVGDVTLVFMHAFRNFPF